MEFEYRKVPVVECDLWQSIANIDGLIWSGIYELRVKDIDKDAVGSPFCTLGDNDIVKLFVSDYNPVDNSYANRIIVQNIVSDNFPNNEGVYTRTCNSVGGKYVWSTWTCERKIVDVGKVDSFDDFKNSGVYSGTYTAGDGLFESFIMQVVNNSLIVDNNEQDSCVSQSKFSLYSNGLFSHRARVGEGNDAVVWGDWVDIGAADTTDIQDNSITAQKLSSDVREILSNSYVEIYTNALNSQLGGNIFDKNAVGILVDKMFLDIFGNIKDQEKYNISDYMAVVPGQTYVVSNIGINPHGYDIYKRHTATIAANSGVFIVPEGTYWIRVAYYQGWVETFCINKGTEILPLGQRTFGLIRTNRLYDGAVTADKITDGAVTEEKIADASVTLDKLSDEVKDIVLSIPVVKKDGAFIVKGNLSSGETLSLPQNSVEVGEYITFSANIDGEFNALYVGHGKNEGAYMKITPTTVTAYSHVSSPVAEQTFEHGLTIENNIQVYIEKKKNSTTDLRISSNGKEYKFFYSSWYGNKGTPFAESEGSELKDCTLSWTCKGIDSDIWAFGDSYFGVTGTIRWMAYLIADGHTNLVVNAFGGQASASAFADLTNLLTIGTPKKILWCLGMNDTDNSTAVNANWLNTYNSLKAVCEENNIELVLATVPTVPTRVNKYKNAFVRSSGYRYIDFDKAVGASETTGEWFSDMLSSDGVHPTESGARALYYRAIVDMPELLSC